MSNVAKSPGRDSRPMEGWNHGLGCRQQLRLSNTTIPITRDRPGQVLWPIQIGGQGAVDRRNLYWKLTLAYDSDHVSGCS